MSVFVAAIAVLLEPSPGAWIAIPQTKPAPRIQPDLSILQDVSYGGPNFAQFAVGDAVGIMVDAVITFDKWAFCDALLEIINRVCWNGRDCRDQEERKRDG